MKEKILALAALIQTQQEQRMRDEGFTVEENIKSATTTRVKPGTKYTKVDIGSSGRFMVEMSTGNIFGIKAYGQIHRGHFYGTLDTTDQYYWGDYYPRRVAQPRTQVFGAPPLTFAPTPSNPTA